MTRLANRSLLPGIFAFCVFSPALAQRTASTTGAGDDEIVVVGAVNRGAALGDIKPQVQLDGATVRSFGVSSVADLITELAPQLGSVQGRGGTAPLILVNGRRISSFAEVRDLPAEAIARVDILPEEVALKYGAPATSKVLNLVLRERFKARTVELAGKTPTEGGSFQTDAEVSYLGIGKKGRINLDGRYQKRSRLTEDERDIALSAPVDTRPFRSLLPQSESASVNVVIDHALTAKTSLTVNARAEASQTDGLNGLPTTTFTVPPLSPFYTGVPVVRRVVSEAAPLVRTAQSLAAHLGFNLSTQQPDWGWSVVGNYDYGNQRLLSDTGLDTTSVQAAIAVGNPAVNPAAALPPGVLAQRLRRLSHATTNSLDLTALTTGRLFSLPAGNVQATFKAGVDWDGVKSDVQNAGLATSARIERRTLLASGNIDIPVARKSEEVLSWLGDMTLNANVAVNDYSDAGTLTTWGAGMTWTPVTPLKLLASYTREEGAPTPQQLGNPFSLAPNSRIFDYIRGVTTQVSQASGGNPLLLSDSRRVFKLEATLKPLEGKDLAVTAAYVNSRIRNPVFSPSAVTPDFEAAFPQRFARAADGTLTFYDSRPINFDSEEKSQLRWGISYSQRIKTKQPDPDTLRKLRELFGQPQEPANQPPAAGGGDTRPPQERGRGFGGGGSRLQLAFYHTWQFRNEIVLKPGLPPINLLDGGTLGGSGGGEPQHKLEAQAGVTYRGLGARLSANWQEATTVRIAGATDTLHFSDLATVNLRLFANLGGRPEWVLARPWFRGFRISLSVDNVFNSRTRVTNSAGLTPAAYQPDFLDPTGRTVRLSLRKVFF